MNRERPSRHGAIVGAALAKIEAAGRADIATNTPHELPPNCATCAFKPGCMTNQMASTVLVALKCAVGADPNLFACHHGMVQGEPTKVCVGWMASKFAPPEEVEKIVAEMRHQLNTLEGPDSIREAFDAWIETVDPEGKLDDYERGRLYLRAFPGGLQA